MGGSHSQVGPYDCTGVAIGDSCLRGKGGGSLVITLSWEVGSSVSLILNCPQPPEAHT